MQGLDGKCSFHFIASILDIVLSYVEPINLVRFFVMHRLDFDKKFVYDMFVYDLTPKEIRCIFCNFPNVIVTGIFIYDISYDLCDMGISMCKVKRVKLIGRKFSCDDEYYERCELDDINVFAGCVSILQFEICDAMIDNLDALNKCVDLRRLKVFNCKYLKSVCGFGRLKYLDVCMCERVEHIGDGLDELRYLSISGCETLFIVGCEKVRALIVKFCGEILNFPVMERLKYLCVRGVSKKMAYIYGLERVQNVLVSGCERCGWSNLSVGMALDGLAIRRIFGMDKF